MQSKLAQCSYVLYNLFDTLCSTVVFPPIIQIHVVQYSYFSLILSHPSDTLYITVQLYFLHLTDTLCTMQYSCISSHLSDTRCTVQLNFLPFFRYTVQYTVEFPPIFQIHCTIVLTSDTLYRTVIFPPSFRYTVQYNFIPSHKQLL